MSADGQSWSPPSQARSDGTRELGRLLDELGSAQAGGTAVAAAAPRCCKFCWAAMAPNSEECRDCGKTVEEMEAAAAEQAEADGRWKPQRVIQEDHARSERLAEAKAQRERKRSVSAGSSKAAKNMVVMIAAAVVIGLFVGGSMVGGLWLAIVTFPHSTVPLVDPDPVPIASAHRRAANPAAGKHDRKSAAHATARTVKHPKVAAAIIPPAPIAGPPTETTEISYSGARMGTVPGKGDLKVQVGGKGIIHVYVKQKIASTSGDGLARATDLPPGNYPILVWAPMQRQRKSFSLDVQPGKLVTLRLIMH